MSNPLSRWCSDNLLHLCRLFFVDPKRLIETRTSMSRSSMILLEELATFLDQRPPVRLADKRKLPLMLLRSDMPVRPYQKQVLAAAKRRSGFIVAPCASGKTLMGLLTAFANGGRVLILTTRYVDQWLRTINAWFQAHGAVSVATLDTCEGRCDLVHIIVATYASFASKPRTVHQRLMRHLVFETVILDEAHTAASPTNLELVDRLSFRYCIALTATKIREDNELEKLEQRIGRTLIDLDRSQLVKDGYIAEVECTNIVIPYADDIERHVPLRIALAINANKMQVLSKVLASFTQVGHRILVFCDDLFCLRWTRTLLSKTCKNIVGTICMETPSEERKRIIQAFQDPECDTTILFISRTGDEALDLPTASAAVIFCNNWASRRQLVQRKGRLARLGGRPSQFVVLLSDKHQELEISKHRTSYAIDHGYQIKTMALQDSPYAVELLSSHDKYNQTLKQTLAKTKA